MKLPINFDQFKTDPIKGLLFIVVLALGWLYMDARNQMTKANTICEKRLTNCENELKKMAIMLKTQDSVCSALTTEIKIYKQLGKI